MSEPMPTVLVPGLNCSSRIYFNQVPHLWLAGPVMIADHSRGDTIEAIARNILVTAPPRFALAGFSLGGYIALEMFRQAGHRIKRLALLNTSARPDTTTQSEHRNVRIDMARSGRFKESLEMQFPRVVHASRLGDDDLRQQYYEMAMEYGAESFVRHLLATIARPDARQLLPSILCPTLVLVGDTDQLTHPDVATEMAKGIAGARLVVVPECGHLSPLERPQVVTEALLAWMRVPTRA